MKFTNCNLCTICITLCICLSSLVLVGTPVASAETTVSDDFSSTPREFWQAMHNTTEEPPVIYEELWSLPEDEQRERIEAMRVIPENQGGAMHEAPVFVAPAGTPDTTETYSLHHPAEWWVSPLNPIGNVTGNYSEIRNIPELGRGDVVNVWGIPNHTYEGGFTVTAADVTIREWEGSPVQPVFTAPGNTTAAVTITADNVTLSRLNFSATMIEGNGGGIFATGTDWTPLEGLCVEGCVFTGNHADEYGGGLCAANINEFKLTDCFFTNNSAGLSGGGMYILESNGHLKNCVCDNNLAGRSGGGGYAGTSDISINNSSFSGNTVKFGDGGGLAVHTGSISLTNTTVSDNNGATLGGGAYFYHLTANISGSSFCYNSRSVFSTDDGGGTYFQKCNATLLNTIIQRNEAFCKFCGGCALYSCNVSFVNTSVTSNYGGYEGGTSVYSSTLHAKDSTFNRNIADFYGGGLNCHSSEIFLETSSVDQNSAMDGGGVYSQGSEIKLSDSSLSNNMDFDSAGGALLLNSNLTLNSTAVSGNLCGVTGGIYSYESKVIAIHSNFTGNSGNCAGAINSIEGNAYVTNSMFTNNGRTNSPAIIGGCNIENSCIIGLDEDIVCTGDMHAINVTFCADDGNTTTISCMGKNIGLGTADVPSFTPAGNKTIQHAIAVTAVNFTYKGGGIISNTSNCNLTMLYSDSDLGAVNESRIIYFLTDGTNWGDVPNTTVLTDKNEVSVNLTEKNLPVSNVQSSGYVHSTYRPNWTTLIPAGPESEEATISLTLKPGWNMISSPFNAVSSVIIPDEVTTMYGYDTEKKVYVNADPLNPCPCNGYWIGATDSCTLNITGVPLTCYEQNLSEGWNMIGCRATPVPVSDLSTSPATPLTLYRYNPTLKQYETIIISEMLLPGEGCWAGVQRCCVLIEE